ncbi:MAG: DNA internalization-related competence protein ComEC/Rec2 [Pseudomonadota bacterium]
MLAGTLAFITGVWCLHRLPVLPEPWLPLLPALLAVALPRQWRAIGLAFLVGVAWAAWDARTVPLPAAYVDRDVTLAGHVEGLPEVETRRTRFRFVVDATVDDADHPPWRGRVRLSWYGGAPELRPGQRLRLTARLREPGGFANPGGFDYSAWLYRRETGATGYVRDGEVVDPAVTGLDGVRWRLARRLDAALGEERAHAGILRALALGDRRAMDDAAWATLLATGTNHLVAISGLHVGLVAGLVYAATRRLWGFWPGLARVVPAPHGAVLAGAAAAAGYAALAGFSVPTQRALVMLLAGALLLLSRRTTDPVRGLALAAWAVLGFDPRTVLEPGFWLSFAAVVVILYGVRGRLRPHSAWRDGVRIQWWVSLGLVPLLLGLFGVASLSAPLANLFMVPLVGLLVVPLVLAGTALATLRPELAGWPLALADTLLSGAWWPLEALAGLEALRLTTPALPSPILALGVVGLFWVHGPRGLPGRCVALALLVPLVFWEPSRPAIGEAWLTALDVGEGSAVVVETRKHTLVYGTGPRFGVGFEAGGDLIAPYLRHRGIERLDGVVLPRDDTVLTGGLAGLAEALPTGERIGDRTVDERDRACAKTPAREWDGVRLRFRQTDGGCRLLLSVSGGGLVLTPASARALRGDGATRYRLGDTGLERVLEQRRDFRRHWH